EPGRMVEPLVWLPSASGTMLAPTAAAEPLEDPPGVCSALCGLRVLPGWKYAHSVVTVLPRTMAPAARSIFTTAASLRGVRPLCSAQPFSVGMSPVSMMSFRPTGTPFSGPTPSPERRFSSAARACKSASFSSRKVQACTWGSTWRMRSRQPCTSSSEVSRPSRMRWAASAAVSAAGCSLAIQELRQPKRHPGPDVHDREAQDDDCHVRHHAGEDLVQRHMLGCNALEVEGRHRHRRREECRLQVDRHHRAEEHRIDVEV